MAAEEAKKKPKALATLMKVFVPLVITVGLCYLLFTGIDFKEMVAIIRRDCDFRWIGLALAISIFSHIFRALRWQIQLDALDCRTPLWYLVLSIFGTYSINLVFPRLGEVWRTGYIAQRQDKPFATVFGSMVCERLSDTVTVLLLTCATFLMAAPALKAFVQKYPEVYTGIVGLLESPVVWGVVIVIAGVIIWLCKSRSDNPVLVKVRGLLAQLWAGFAVIAKMNHKGRWLFFTVCLWGCYFIQLYVSFYAFPFTRELLAAHGAIVALVCFVLSSIAMGIPSNGGIGPWQIAIIFGMTIYAPAGMDEAAMSAFKMNATAFANLVMGAQTLLLILLGIFTFIAIAISKHRVTGKKLPTSSQP